MHCHRLLWAVSQLAVKGQASRHPANMLAQGEACSLSARGIREKRWHFLKALQVFERQGIELMKKVLGDEGHAGKCTRSWRVQEGDYSHDPGGQGVSSHVAESFE